MNKEIELKDNNLEQNRFMVFKKYLYSVDKDACFHWFYIKDELYKWIMNDGRFKIFIILNYLIR